MKQLLRFNDLEAAGVVTSRAQLSRWQRDIGFPRGYLIGPNTRVYNRSDIDGWLAERERMSRASDTPNN